VSVIPVVAVPTVLPGAVDVSVVVVPVVAGYPEPVPVQAPSARTTARAIINNHNLFMRPPLR
jgi:hypothetical protein